MSNDKDVKIKPAKKSKNAVMESYPAAPTDAEYILSLERSFDEEVPVRVLMFFLEGREYALPVDQAVEVMRPKTLTEVPKTPPFVLGIFAVRGDMLPVIDLSARLGLATAVSYMDRKVVVASIDGVKAAFTVDRLAGVRDIQMSGLEPGDALFVSGLINRDGRMIRLIDSKKLLDFSI